MIKWVLIVIAALIAIRLLVIIIKDEKVYKERQITKSIKTIFSYEPKDKGVRK